MTIERNWLLGLDIGGTNTPYVLSTLSGEILRRGSLPTMANRPVNELLDRIFAHLDAELCCAVGPRLAAVGVGAPNANPHTGWIEAPPNIEWESLDLAAAFACHTPGTLFLTNDANAAAFGEWRIAWEGKVNNLLVVTLGTGLGSGFICEGRLLQGGSGHAGELGHVRVEYPGLPCNCGLHGCLETRVSAKGIVRIYRELLQGGHAGSLNPAAITPKELYHAAEAGDECARQTFERAAEYLARGLATAIHISSPERILLCGGIARAGHWILDPVNKILKNYLMEPFQGTCPVEASRLGPDDAGVLGALEWARAGMGLAPINLPAS